MRQNPARRTALLDAAVEVLAGEGSRGLTLRAVDAKAGVPNGTASNYFANRAELLRQVMERIRERLTPDASALGDTMKAEPSRELVTTLMHQLIERMRGDRSSHLAMLELRLEATRRPELQAELTRVFSAELDDSIRFHLDAGLPGGRDAVVLLYLAMRGLIVDDLTVPGLLAPYPLDDLIGGMVAHILPPDAPRRPEAQF